MCGSVVSRESRARKCRARKRRATLAFIHQSVDGVPKMM